MRETTDLLIHSQNETKSNGFFFRLASICRNRKQTFIENRTSERPKELTLADVLLLTSCKLDIDDHKTVQVHIDALRKQQPLESIDALYRYNLLFSRAKLYQFVLRIGPKRDIHHVERVKKPEGLSGEEMEELKNALDDYSRALDAYRTFRKAPGLIDDDSLMMAIGGMLTLLDDKRSKLNATMQNQNMTPDSPENDAVLDEEANIDAGKPAELWGGCLDFESQITNLLVQWASYSSAGVRPEEESNDRLKFLSRLVMALFGGAALVVPMLIMTLRPSKLTGLLTTSLFVVAVAVTLAFFMKDAGPKDVIAATAAYAAVLVVFVGGIDFTTE